MTYIHDDVLTNEFSAITRSRSANGNQLPAPLKKTQNLDENLQLKIPSQLGTKIYSALYWLLNSFSVYCMSEAAVVAS